MKRHTPFIVLLLLFITGCANGLFYHPDNRLYQTPDRPYEEVSFESIDGTRLTGWFIASSQAVPFGTVIHFHGNAANISNHYGFVEWLPEAGFNLLLFDYRGYGDSEGKPGRRGVFEDSVAALKYAASRPDVDPSRLIAFGQSLGGANAVAAAAATPDVPLKGVVVDSAFFSYRSIARDKIGLIPVLKWLKWPLSFVMATNGHSPGPVIERLSPTPVLIIHGTKDRVIPYDHGRRLYDAAASPKTMWTVKGGVHTDALMTWREIYREKLAATLRNLAEGKPALE
ncbi:alpha/beta hydrolase [Desulfoluna butyratoxydans]|uniref:Alpha/beta hydrolase fold n=1 Tax=Desulfoluna butyratoxydans TaxID=231438 RepID=A0A4V6ILZ1_9BACT|nr:alpha/beta hydrolase [Desulfoluna butyratoxydans]VFQ46968.1 alpha/beta hydrolase fold [Desulfoluna butyratoxydans]